MTKLSGSDAKSTLYCSFCGKSQHEVRKLIAGPTVFICDECVELCNDIIREETKAGIAKIPTIKRINTFFPASSPGAANPNCSRTCSPATAQHITDLIVDWLTADLRPLNVIHDEVFRSFLAYLTRAYLVPSCTHITTYIK